MKVSYIFSACNKHDAISNAVRDEITALRVNGIEEVRLYGHVCQYDSLPFFRIESVRDIVMDSHFQASNLVVFHFGIYNPLFDLLAIVPRRARRLVIFHNVTPKEFVAPEHGALIDKSIAQMANMLWADHVICDSETNLSVLRSFGIYVPASVLPLAVHLDTVPPPIKPSFEDGILRVVFVGRFVQSKGPHELLGALENILHAGLQGRLRLDMVGNLVHSDLHLVNDIELTAQRLERTYEPHFQVRIHGNATDTQKQKLLRDADLFALPTYHEGFCVPILEAFASGCKVVAYDNSNTPAVSGGLATLTPTGNVERLALAIKATLEQISSTEWRGRGVGSYAEYSRLTGAYAQQFAPERIGPLFVNLARNLLDTSEAVSNRTSTIHAASNGPRACY